MSVIELKMEEDNLEEVEGTSDLENSPQEFQIVVEKGKVLHQCPHCPKKIDSKYGILNHMRIHLKDAKQLTCVLCKEKFETNNELIMHKEIHKKENRSFICAKCEIAFTDHCDFVVHNIEHTCRKLYKCDECHKYFKHKFSMKKHVSSHYDRKVKCKICKKVCNNDDLLQNHMVLHNNPHECCECGRHFTTKSYLDYHMISHTGVKLHQCLYCGKGFSNIQQKVVHTRTHTNERPFECKKCGKKFKQGTDLQRHICQKDIATDKLFQCDICKKKFKIKMSLIPHMRIHTEEKPFKCDICLESFITIVSLKVHSIYKHSDEKPFMCSADGCKTAFKTKRDCKRHEMTKHKMHEDWKYQ